MSNDRFLISLSVSAIALSMSAFAALAAEDFKGTWKVTDTAGKPFEIVLEDGGKAKADRSGEGLAGTWTAQGDSAVIMWDTGWKTTIAKTADGYTKTASKKGDGKPAATSPAEKVK